MKVFFVLLLLYMLCFSLHCHFTISYGVFPFLLMFPAAELIDLSAVQRREMRSSLTDLHTHFGRRHAALRHTMIGTFVIVGGWIMYLLHTLETCSVELSMFTAALMAAIALGYIVVYVRFRRTKRECWKL